MTDPSTKNSRLSFRALCVAGIPSLWLLLFFFVPLLIIAVVSFLSRGDYGELQLPFTLESYKRLCGSGLFGFDSLYPMILLRSVLLGALTAFICVTAGLPLAFFIARLPARWKVFALTL